MQTLNLAEDGINTIEVGDLRKGVYHLVLVRRNGERVVKRFLK